mmetsp:Transcript_61699/g.191695  ORF Transcript_61699/g.191695 Transcript_61699/m.191695 type:complete len:228 (-) Transcript_61699:63-746(-)
MEEGCAPLTVSGAGGLLATVTRLSAGCLRSVLTQEVGAEAARLTWADVISGLCSEAPELRDLLSELLRRMPFEAFYWECPPVSRSTAAARPFEFVCADAPHLSRAGADPVPFSEHLAGLSGQPVAKAFLNLGGDSVLVAPAWAADDAEVYAHVAAFFRQAASAQHHAQWRELGAALQQRLQDQGPTDTVWVSTEGSGVSWLHMRLDPCPKYFHHKAYCDPAFGMHQQ